MDFEWKKEFRGESAKFVAVTELIGNDDQKLEYYPCVIAATLHDKSWKCPTPHNSCFNLIS